LIQTLKEILRLFLGHLLDLGYYYLNRLSVISKPIIIFEQNPIINRK